jgi:sorbitol/mannitol transport system permease protein
MSAQTIPLARASRLRSAQNLKTRKPDRRERWRRRAPLLPALIFTIIVTQLPFVFTLIDSLRSWNLVRPGSNHWVGFANYANVFRDAQFRGAALVSIFITVGCVFVSLLLGTVFAMLLDRPFRGRGVVRTLFITPFLIMPVAAALLWKTTMFDPIYGLVNFVLKPFGVGQLDWLSQHPLASVMTEIIWQWTPFMMLLVLAGLQSQPRDVLEAASVDGASPWRTFFEITLPHLRRYLELSVLLGAIYIVNTFDAIYIMTQGGPGTETSNLPFYIYQRAFLGFDVGQAAAMGVVVVIGTLIVATFALRLLFKSFFADETGV